MSITPSTPGAETFLLPFENVAQNFQISIAGVTYTITNKWNDIGQYWVLDIADSNDAQIVSNVPLVTGGDCLSGLDYLQLGFSIYVITNGSSPLDTPTLDNLGIDSNVYFLVVTNG